MKLPNCDGCKKPLRNKARIIITIPRSKVAEERGYGYCMPCAQKKDFRDMIVGGLFSHVEKAAT